MQVPAIISDEEAKQLPAILDSETAAKHNWFTNFVNFKAGPVPYGLTKQESIRHQIATIEHLFAASVSAGETIDSCDSYPLRNIFAPGVYLRELTIPAGHFVVGKLHRHAHANFISRGKVSVLTEEGGWEILVGPCTLLSPAGVKRLLFTHEETVWTVVHPTDLTDVEAIEEAVLAKCYTDIGMTEPVLVLPPATADKEGAA